MANRIPKPLSDVVKATTGKDLTGEVKKVLDVADAKIKTLKQGLVESFGYAASVSGLTGARELSLQGAVLQELMQNEHKPKGVRVFCVVGTSPRIARVTYSRYR